MSLFPGAGQIEVYSLLGRRGMAVKDRGDPCLPPSEMQGVMLKAKRVGVFQEECIASSAETSTCLFRCFSQISHKVAIV